MILRLRYTDYYGRDYSKDFTVTSYVRDSQMNSTLCSSTRFLINEEEHDEIKNRIGKIEYLIEFYFPMNLWHQNFRLPMKRPECRQTGSL